MKKIIVAAAIALVLLMSICCAAEKANVIGDWYLIAVTGADANDNGIMFTLAEDGNALFAWGNKVIEAKWKAEGNLIKMANSGDDLISMELQADGSMTCEVEGVNYTFSKADPTEPEEVVEDTQVSSVDAFMGIWEATTIEMYGQAFPAEEYGIDLIIAVGDGEISLISADEEYTFDAAIRNGVLIAGDEEETLEYRLRSNGTLACDLEEDDVIMTIVLERIN